MAPTARKPLVLGFLGQAEISSKNAEALLSDLIEAESGKAKFVLAATADLWSDSIEGLADYALENEIPLVLVTDDSTAGEKSLKGYVQQAAETVKVINPVNKLVKLTAEGGGKLIMLWDDEDDACYTALELAEEEGIEALDLTASLHKLEFTGGGDKAADDDTEAPAAEEEVDLDEMDEAELQDLAESLGLDVEKYPEWDDVRDAIRTKWEEDEGEEGWPTADEVMEWEFEALKEFAQANEIEVPPRSKTTGYRIAVRDFLMAAAEHEDALEREEGALQLPDDDGHGVIIDMTEVKAEVESLRADISSVAKRIDAMSRAAAEHMIELRTMLMEVTKAGTVQKAQQEATKGVSKSVTRPTKAAAPAKKAPSTTKAVQRPQKAPQKAAPAKAASRAPAKATKSTTKAGGSRRSVNRPAAKKAPTDGEKERPLDPFMHLLNKRLTKAQAKEVMIAAQSRGRGRPTEDERTLIAAAKELVPNV